MGQNTMYLAKANSPLTLLSADITASDIIIPLLDVSVLPDGPNLATILYGTTSETILYTEKNGSTLTGVTRGFQGVANDWPVGTQIGRMFTAYDYDTFKNNIEDLNNNKAGTTVATTSTDGLESSSDKTKLDGIATNANNYSHPVNHLPSVITQDASNRFVTDTEKSTWNAKANARISPTSVTVNTTLALTHAGKRLLVNSGSAVTITIPLNSSVAFTIGDEIELVQYGAGVVTLAPYDAGVTIRSRESALSIDGQYGAVSLVKIASDEWLLVGALA